MISPAFICSISDVLNFDVTHGCGTCKSLIWPANATFWTAVQSIRGLFHLFRSRVCLANKVVSSCVFNYPEFLLQNSNEHWGHSEQWVVHTPFSSHAVSRSLQGASPQNWIKKVEEVVTTKKIAIGTSPIYRCTTVVKSPCSCYIQLFGKK